MSFRNRTIDEATLARIAALAAQALVILILFGFGQPT